MKNIFKFLRNKNNKKSIFLWIMILIVAVTSSIFIGKVLLGGTKNEDLDISVVLEKAEYSYLPVEAKNYIKIVYEKTGQLVLTEKNKEKGQPYLNPKFVTYLSMSSNEREKEAIVPKELIVDYVYSENGSDTITDDIPSKFDLRNIDGKNYVTPLKNQGNLGICWSFATNGQVENYLLKKNGVSYSEEAKIFSERQLDYITSNDGLKDYTSEFAAYRNLGSGGNFIRAVYPMISGLGLVDVSWKEYNDRDYTSMEAYEVLNFGAAEYEVNGTFNVPAIDFREYSKESKESYLNTVKNYIMKYGGAYVGTQAPGYSCSAVNLLDEFGSYIIREDDTCSPDGSHAMIIIGWDDDYKYSYCEDDYSHVAGTSCSSSQTLVTGKGAWLLKNSWGEGSGADYAYLAYDSLNNDINLINDISDINSKKWDNVYFDNSYINTPYLWKNTVLEVIIDPAVDDVVEKLEKIKFQSYTQNGVYKIYLYKDSVPRLLETVETAMPGIYNVDLSEFNITIAEGDKATLHFVGIDDSYMLLPVFAYTSNAEETPVAVTEDYSYSNRLDVIDTDYYKFRLLTKTKNIPSMERIEYKLFDDNGTDVSSYLNYNNDFVAHNVVNASIEIGSNIGMGDYTLQTIYNGIVLDESIISLNIEISAMKGSGTENDPYIITSEEELKLIEEDLNAYYKLGNDITLQEDWVPLGYKNESGFTGSLDGNGYKISGLNIDEDFMFNGLFFTIAIGEDHDTVVKNLVIDDADISVYSNEYSGILSGFVSDNYFGLEYNEPYSIYIDNISIVNSTVAYSYAAGALFGQVYISRNDSLIINNVFSNSLVSAQKYVGGIIGGVLPSVRGAESLIRLSNIQNIGTVMSHKSLPSSNEEDISEEVDVVASHLFGYLGTDVSLSNVLLTGGVSINSFDVFGSIVGQFERNGSLTINNSINNVYYSDSYNNIVGISNDGITITGPVKKDIVELTDETLYSSWKDFSIYWNKFTPSDGIPRIPILASQQTFDYTTLSKSAFNLFKGQHADFYEAFDVGYRLRFEINDEFATVYREDLPYVFNILKNGDTFVSVVSNYDGYKNTIPVNISDDNVKFVITFHSNYANDQTYTQSFNDFSYNAWLEKNRFSREGYHFYFWTTNFDGSGTIYTDSTHINPKYIDEDFDLYAKWVANEYTVKYDANGASGQGKVPNQKFVYDKGDKLFRCLFNKEGYKFAGWNTKSDGKGQMFTEGEEVINLTSKDDDVVILYAQWIPIEYTVIFDANGGTGSASNQKINYNSTEKLNLNKFVKVGYDFVGWNTNTLGTGIAYSDGQEVTNLSVVDGKNIILYAQWKPINYSVKFDVNGGTGEMARQEFTYGVSKSLNVNTFTKEGYKFAGWNTDSEGRGISYNDGQEILNLTTLSGEVILYAQWIPIKYTVSFDKNNGEGEMGVQEFTYDLDGKLKDNEYNKIGYTFKEWNSDINGKGISYQNGQEITNLLNTDGNIILYAQWIPIEYSVRFDANGGEGNLNNQSFKYDESYNLSKNVFTKDGYKFAGWNSNIEGNGTDYSDEAIVSNLSAINGDVVTLYAKWRPISYSVRFDANGGEGSMDIIDFVYDVEQQLPENLFVRDGYEIKAWNTKADGSGISYNDKALIKNLTTNEETITLYVIWKVKSTYKINNYEFDANGYLTKIELQTIVDDYLKNITIGNNYSVKVFNLSEKELNNSDLIFTGSTTKIYLNNEVVETFVNVVRGDVDGDGKLKLPDIMKMANYVYVDRNSLVGAFSTAADFDNASGCNLQDIMKSAKALYGGK